MPWLSDMNLARCIEGAEHIKALNIRDVHIDEPPFPWEHVGRVETASEPCIGIHPHLRFWAKHPCGVVIYWSIQVCEWDHDSGGLKMNSEIVSEALAKMPEQHRGKVTGFIQALGDKIDEEERARDRSAAKRRDSMRELIGFAK